jgi:DNA mismatch repair protein MutS
VEGKTWLAELEAEEREKTGIKNLRIKYNKVFGYYLEVTNSYQDLVPEYYSRKQTLANAERYSIPRLKELEDMILGAEDKLFALEYELYCEVRERIAAEMLRIQQTAKAIAQIDVLASLALVAERNNYVRPNINEKGVIDIKNGRHPVVEKMIPNDMFIANDTYLVVPYILKLFHDSFISFSNNSFSCFKASLDAVTVWLNDAMSDRISFCLGMLM